MADVFVSYAAEDGEVARYVAEGLKREGFDVWYYQRDGQTPGADYMDNIGEGVRAARVVVLFVSPKAILSPQCNQEAQIAWEEDKKLIPLLKGVTYDQLLADKRGRRWADRIGSRVSIQIDGQEPQAVLDAVRAGLLAARRTTNQGAPAYPSSPASAVPTTLPPGRHPLPSSSSGKIVAAIVGGLGFLYCLNSLLRILSPPTPNEAWVLQTFPNFKWVTFFVNLAGVAQNAALLYGAWLVHRGESRGASLIRKTALSIFATVGLWLLVSFFTFAGSRVPGTGTMIGLSFLLSLVAVVPAGIVFWLFRRAK
jgi:hypothetical protein